MGLVSSAQAAAEDTREEPVSIKSKSKAADENTLQHNTPSWHPTHMSHHAKYAADGRSRTVRTRVRSHTSAQPLAARPAHETSDKQTLSPKTEGDGPTSSESIAQLAV
jgi:hypothetical protein